MTKLYEEHYEFDLTHDKIIADSVTTGNVGKSYREGQDLLIHERLHHDDIHRITKISDAGYLRKKLASGISDIDIKYRIKKTKSCAYRWKTAHVTIFTSPTDGSLRTMWFVKDINDSVEQESALADKALRDTLTGLYNKSATELLISQKLAADAKKDHSPLNALLVLDLDNFKAANDLMGHIFGDALLTETSQKLTKVFRSSDIVGRIGGDEFMVLMKDIPCEAVALRKANEARSVITKINRGGIADLTVSASIGIAFSHGDGTTFEDLYRKADIALYRSKDSGKNFVSAYEQSMGDTLDREPTVHEFTKQSKETVASFSENQLRYIFSLLYTAKNTKEAIKGAMELLINHFNLSRAYVFETNPDRTSYKELFEVCSENTTPNIEMLSKGTKAENRPNYPKNFNKSGIFTANVADLEEPLKTEMARQDIITLIQVAIMGNGNFRGFLGFDICDSDVKLCPKDIATLSSAGKMLAWFTLREFDKNSAQLIRDSSRHALCEFDRPMFVVNSETMELLFISTAAAERVGNLPLGTQCYAAIFQKTKPCENCPLLAAIRDADSPTGLLCIPVFWDLFTTAKAVNCLSVNKIAEA